MGGCCFTTCLVSPQKAKKSSFIGIVLSAHEIAKLGLINQLVSFEELENKKLLSLPTRLQRGLH